MGHRIIRGGRNVWVTAPFDREGRRRLDLNVTRLADRQGLRVPPLLRELQGSRLLNRVGGGKPMDRRIGLALPAVALGVALLAAGSLATGTSPPVAAEVSLLGSLSVDGAPVDAVAAAATNSTLNCTRAGANAPIHCTASNPDGLKKIDVGPGLPTGTRAPVAHTTTRAGTSAAAAPGAHWTGALSLRVDAAGSLR